jgi:hypothetical protein
MKYFLYSYLASYNYSELGYRYLYYIDPDFLIIKIYLEAFKILEECFNIDY